MDFKTHKAQCEECQMGVYPCPVGMGLIPKISIEDVSRTMSTNHSEQMDIEWAILSWMHPEEPK